MNDLTSFQAHSPFIMRIEPFIYLFLWVACNALVSQQFRHIPARPLKVVFANSLTVSMSKDFEGYPIDQSGDNSSFERKLTRISNTSPNSFPPRQDTCSLVFSGVVGTQAKEIYLRQGNYVVRFSVSILSTIYILSFLLKFFTLNIMYFTEPSLLSKAIINHSLRVKSRK